MLEQTVGNASMQLLEYIVTFWRYSNFFSRSQPHTRIRGIHASAFYGQGIRDAMEKQRAFKILMEAMSLSVPSDPAFVLEAHKDVLKSRLRYAPAVSNSYQVYRTSTSRICRGLDVQALYLPRGNFSAQSDVGRGNNAIEYAIRLNCVHLTSNIRNSRRPRQTSFLYDTNV